MPDLSIVELDYDHSMMAPALATFYLRHWQWTTGPTMTAAIRHLHRLSKALHPRPLLTHTVWRLRKSAEYDP